MFIGNLVVALPGSNSKPGRQMTAEQETAVAAAVANGLASISGVVRASFKRPASLEIRFSFPTYTRPGILGFFREVLRGSAFRASLNVWHVDTRMGEPFASVSLGPRGLHWRDDGAPVNRDSGAEGRPQ